MASSMPVNKRVEAHARSIVRFAGLAPLAVKSGRRPDVPGPVTGQLVNEIGQLRAHGGIRKKFGRQRLRPTRAEAGIDMQLELQPQVGLRLLQSQRRQQELYATLRQRAATEHTSIRALINDAIESKLNFKPSRRVTGPLVGTKRRIAPGSPDRENPYDILFA